MPTKRAIYDIIDFKAASDGSGEFTALVSVFGNVDLVGDRVMPDAFTNTLAAWKASGDPIPIIWSHDWQDPFAHIGFVTNAVVTPKGLQLSGKNDVEKPFAKQVHDLLVARRVKNWSFAYDVINEKRASDGANELLELGLIEAGPTLVGANTSTDTISAKALLDAAAAKDLASRASTTASLSGRKLYLEADLPGAFEETRDLICEAARELLNPAGDEHTWVYVQATFPTHALVEVSRSGADDEQYQIDWSMADDGTITLGEPMAVEVNVTVTPKSATKAGRRLSQATETEMQGIRADAAALVARIDTLLGTAEDAATSSGDAAGAKGDAEPNESGTGDGTKSTEGPTAKSTDATVTELRTRIAEMRATTGIPA